MNILFLNTQYNPVHEYNQQNIIRYAKRQDTQWGKNTTIIWPRLRYDIHVGVIRKEIKIIMISMLRACDGVPMTTVRLDGLLERLPGLRKSCSFMIKLYYSGRIQIKISKWNDTWGKVQEKTGTCFLISLPRESHRNALNFPRMTCENTW